MMYIYILHVDLSKTSGKFLSVEEFCLSKFASAELSASPITDIYCEFPQFFTRHVLPNIF